MKNIKSFQELSEDQTVFSDSDAYGGNSLFKIRLRQLGDLSGHPGKGQKEPVGEFADGDIVKGTGEEDHKEHEGQVISVKWDEKTGEPLEVVIEEDGKTLKLVPVSITVVKDNGADRSEGNDDPGNGDDRNEQYQTLLEIYKQGEESGD